VNNSCNAGGTSRKALYFNRLPIFGAASVHFVGVMVLRSSKLAENARMSKTDANASNVIPFPSERIRRPPAPQPCVIDWESSYHQEAIKKDGLLASR
jgi:hypothetical protein